MTIHERISALFLEFETILHSLASSAAEVAPVAEAIEAVAAPEDIAPTEAAAAVAEKVAEETPAA